MDKRTKTPIPFGQMMTDYETRIDFVKMRKDRLERTRAAMAEADLDYLLLLRLENCRYTTGVKRIYWPTIRLGGGPVVLIPRDGEPAVWITDIKVAAKTLPWIKEDRILEPYEMEIPEEVERFVDDLTELCGPDIKQARIGVDIWAPVMQEIFRDKLPKAHFMDGQDVMIQAQMIKTAEELACLKMAYVMSEAGMQAAVDILRPGVRECELVGTCFKKFWDLGSETTQCSQAVNSGPGNFPYRRFHTDRIIQAGEMVNMDFGACFCGYFGDFCRSFTCGPHTSAKQAELMKRAYDQLMDKVNAIQPGLTAKQVCEKLNMRRVAHGIGIAAFQAPHIHESNNFVIQPGMIFCVDTTAGELGVGGAHLEDQVVVTETGCEIYSTYPYTCVDGC